MCQALRSSAAPSKTVLIMVNPRRYRCQNCGKRLFDPLLGLDSKRLATARLIHYVRSESFRETFAVVARRVDMDEKTVRHASQGPP